MLRVLPIVLFACAKPIPPPTPEAALAGCVVATLVGQLADDLIAPVLAGERAGTLTIDASTCGVRPVVDATLAAQITAGIALAVPGIAFLAARFGGCGVDAWTASLAPTVAALGIGIVDALGGSGRLEVPWAAPDVAACQ